MNTYRFHFNNNKKTRAILFWFFTALPTIALTAIILVLHPDPLFPAWLLLISLPLMLVAIYKLLKLASKARSAEIISLGDEGFTSSYFGSVLLSEIHTIQVPVKQIGLFGGRQRDYYKNTDVDIPYLKFSITTLDGKILNWILNEWGGLYNSEEEFSIFFNFLTALTDQLYQLYYSNEPYNSYLKILNENGFWEKRD
ncbi:MAG: hypothetical protein J7577_11830 [Sphingobacteriaceae bacterium]|nr:hypothetical protein [Sphingobacteriaceae bacterium]